MCTNSMGTRVDRWFLIRSMTQYYGDECMERHYAAPTIENIEVYGTYKTAYTDASETSYSYDGPWNFSYYRSSEGMLKYSMYNVN